MLIGATGAAAYRLERRLPLVFLEDLGREALLYGVIGALSGLAVRAAASWWQVNVSVVWPALGVYWTLTLFFPGEA